MYRAFALGLLRKNIDPKDGEAAQNAVSSVPVRVEYSLTPRAETLMPILDALEDWSMAELY